MKSKKGFIITFSTLILIALLLGFVMAVAVLYVIIKALPFLIVLVFAAMIVGIIYLLLKPEIDRRYKK